jgi:hypothetical protein
MVHAVKIASPYIHDNFGTRFKKKQRQSKINKIKAVDVNDIGV